MKSNYYVHPSSIVDTKEVGKDTTIWAFVHILKNVSIGQNCNINDHCFIEDGVTIGNNVTVKCGIYIWKGVFIEDNVFLGPNVVFTNDKRPRSKHWKTAEKTRVKNNASIGANSTILCGITIGKFAMTGIGSVVTKNVPDHALVYGNPALQHGWVDENGLKLLRYNKEDIWVSNNGLKYKETATGLKKI